MNSRFGALSADYDADLSSGWPPLPVAERGPARPAVFIDKDGTLVENVPDNVDPAQLRFLPGALAALGGLAAAGYELLIVTNQPELALGSFGRAQFAQLQAALLRRLQQEAGVVLQDFVVCPHAPGEAGRPACLCRKPAPGMLLRAARMHNLDLAASWMVGDILDDIEAGRRAGCRTLLLDSGGETLWRLTPMRQPHARCASWDEVAAHILHTAPAVSAVPVP